MNKEHASKGYKKVSGTSPVTFKFYGFNVISEAVIASITAPTDKGQEGDAYDGDEPGMVSETVPVGYYPIRGSAITLTSGKLILWKE
jgi:hypothetical protein